MSKNTQIPSFPHRLTHQYAVQVDQEPTPAGVPPQTAAETWVTQGTYWAKVEPQTVRRSVGIDTPSGSLWHKIIMRNPRGVTIKTRDRFLFLGRILIIDSVQRVDEMNGLLEITATEYPPL